MAIAPDVFEQYPIGRWKVGSAEEVRFVVLSITEAIGNRLIRHERPFRDGAKLDDTGAIADSWNCELLFSNTVEEPGQEGNPRPMYPDMLRVLRESARVHQTGDLTLPTVGRVRARLESMSRTETADERDTARVGVVFVNDNEDSLDAAQQRPPTVRSSAAKLAQQTKFTTDSLGAFDVDLGDLTEFASDLEGLLLAPGRAVDDVTTQVRRNRRAIARIQRAQEQLADDVETSFSDPEGSEAVRQLRLLSDRQAQADTEKTASRPRTRTYTVGADTTLFAIAAALGQDPEELLDLNSGRVDDPLDLRRGDTIRVFET